MRVEGVRIGPPHVARDFDHPAAGVAEHLLGRVDQSASDSLVPVSPVHDQRADASYRFRTMKEGSLMESSGANEFALGAIHDDPDISATVPRTPARDDVVLRGGVTEFRKQP